MKVWLILILIVLAVLIALGIFYAPMLTFKILKGTYKGVKFVGKKVYKGAKFIGSQAYKGFSKLNRHRKNQRYKSLESFPEHRASSIRHVSNSDNTNSINVDKGKTGEGATINVKIDLENGKFQESNYWE